ncbi:MAG: CDC48 family AAA ATPase [Candidatus Hydrothermarchaeota archaeon]
MKQIELRVAESMPQDVGKGIVRIDGKSLAELGLVAGDIVEIRGEKIGVAIVNQGYPMDEGLGIVRMDGVVRYNAGANIGGKVKVRKAQVKNARRIRLSPIQPVRFRSDFQEYVRRRIIKKPLIRGNRIDVPVFNTALSLIVTSTDPSGSVLVTEETQINISDRPIKDILDIPAVTYEDIGGLKEEIQKVREMIELPLRHPQVFEKLGIKPPKGVLLHGPPGTGKTLLARAVAHESNAHIIMLNAPEIMGKYYGESEERLREIFKQGHENAPSIIFIDEIDAIAPKREEVTGEVEKRVVAQLLSLMDGLKEREKVIVVAATNRPNALDPALRRPGRFDREIEIGIPDRDARFEILQIHTRNMPLEDVDLEELANSTHGFVGADIAALCREAAMSALRKVLPEIDLEAHEISPDTLEKLVVRREDFKAALKDVGPSALREVYVEIPNVRWSDIGGLEEVKKELKKAIEWPLKYPDEFEELGIKPPHGILLYGPPGTGKTMLAKAIATEAQANFISIKGPELLSKWVGESEKAVREVFKKARQTAPCIIFFDEVDSIVPRRGTGIGDSRVTERIISQILTELDGIEELTDVVVIAATNRPDIIDPALFRPGRFDKIIYVPEPDQRARLEIFRVHTKNMPLGDDVDIEWLAGVTEGYTGADIAALCQEAAMIALEEIMGKDVKRIEMRHFDEALKSVKPSLSKEVIFQYEKFTKEREKRGTILDEDFRVSYL